MSIGRLAPETKDRRDAKRTELVTVLLFDAKEEAEIARRVWARTGYRTRVTPRSVRADRVEAYLYVLTVREPKPRTPVSEVLNATL